MFRIRSKRFSRRLLSGLFTTAGVLHFAWPEPFERIVPPALPEPRALVYLSGAFEVLGGVGLLPEATRRWAGRGLALLLVAVFPANWYMAQHPEAFARVPAWALYARLPLQAVLIAWVLWASAE